MTKGASMTDKNGRATIREVRDLIDELKDDQISPMRDNIEGVKADIKYIVKSLDSLCRRSNNFVSRPAFFGWLGALAVAIGIAVTILTVGG